MHYSDLVQIYFERSNALQWLWTLYVVIIGGLLAFASLRKQRDFLTTLLITVLFSFFAYKNLGGIEDITNHRFAVLAAIKEAAPNESRRHLDPTLTPPAWPGVRNFHIASSLLTIATLWAMERRRAKKELGGNTGPAAFAAQQDRLHASQP